MRLNIFMLSRQKCQKKTLILGWMSMIFVSKIYEIKFDIHKYFLDYEKIIKKEM